MRRKVAGTHAAPRCPDCDRTLLPAGGRSVCPECGGAHDTITQVQIRFVEAFLPAPTPDPLTPLTTPNRRAGGAGQLELPPEDG